jgi:hypothetical protein
MVAVEHLGDGKCPFGFGATDSQPGFAHSAVPEAMSRDKLPELLKAPVEVGEDGLRTGRCLCGRVSFKIKTAAEKVFANHDAASRRWTGGVAMTMMVRATNTAFHGWGNVVQFGSSERARQCFCRICGTSLFVRHVQPEAMDGMLSLSAGCLDAHDGLTLAAETYVDRKPDFYAFAGERRGLTEAEVEAMFAPRPAAE